MWSTAGEVIHLFHLSPKFPNRFLVFAYNTSENQTKPSYSYYDCKRKLLIINQWSTIQWVGFGAHHRRDMPESFQSTDKKPHCDVSQMAFPNEKSHLALSIDNNCVLRSESGFSLLIFLWLDYLRFFNWQNYLHALS